MQEDILTVNTSVTTATNQDTVKPVKDPGEKPKFGSQPKFSSLEFDFQKELDRLPFSLNLGKVKMSKEQKSGLWS